MPFSLFFWFKVPKLKSGWDEWCPFSPFFSGFEVLVKQPTHKLILTIWLPGYLESALATPEVRWRTRTRGQARECAPSSDKVSKRFRKKSPFWQVFGASTD